MIGIDLFAGAGGMALGAEMAGVKVAFAIESDPYAAETYAHNHPFTEVRCENIQRVEHLPDLNGSEPIVLFGGPPCQSFSTSNQRTRSAANPASWLFMEFLRLVHEVGPTWVVFENVKGIVETEGGVFLTYVTDGLRDIGFLPTSWILDASRFGVPQRRNRLFVVAHRNGYIVQEPKSTVEGPVTVRQAISDLPSLPNGAAIDWLPYRPIRPSVYARSMRGSQRGSQNHYVTRNADYVLNRYRTIPPGGNWEDIPRPLLENYDDPTKCHTGIYHRLSPDEPSVVIGNYRKNMLIHPTEDRGLSVREAARLQSFPDSYVFKGSIGFQQQQVGDAVPPLLARAVFKELIAIESTGRTRRSHKELRGH